MTLRTRKNSADRKREIIETAIKVAADLGPDRMTVQLLADAIGISQPAIFRHFPTKAEIWQGVAGRICEIMQENAAGALDAKARPEQRLRQLVIAQLTFIQTTPAVPAILFSKELHADNEDLRQEFARLMGGRHLVFSELVSTAIQSRTYRSDLDADSAAFLILALIQGLAMRWSLCKRCFDLPSEGAKLFDLQEQAFFPSQAG